MDRLLHTNPIHSANRSILSSLFVEQQNRDLKPFEVTTLSGYKLEVFVENIFERMKFVSALPLLVASASAFYAQPTAFRPTSLALHATDELEAPPLSPLTLWGDKISNIRQLQQEMRKADLPEFAPEIHAKDLGLAGDTAAQLQYFKDNAMDLKEKMENHGAVVFRGFELMKTQDGFQQFYQAVGMKTCLDPLHSVSARPTVDGKKNSPVYEAVNKESRKNFFIGE